MEKESCILVKTESKFNTMLATAKDQLVMVDFFATWCGPCGSIAPKIEELAKANSTVIFLKVDVDKCPDLADEYNISQLPTFVFIKNKKLITTCPGNVTQLKQNIKKFK